MEGAVEEEMAEQRGLPRGPRQRQVTAVVEVPEADQEGAGSGEELQTVAEAQVPVAVGRVGRLLAMVPGCEAGGEAPAAAGGGR